jgi:multimeric flavodoxin WrbA
MRFKEECANVSNNNTRLLVAVDVNSRFPKDFSKYIEKSTLKTNAQVIQKVISDGNIIDNSRVEEEIVTKYSSERSHVLKREADFTLKNKFSTSDVKLVDTSDISLEDIIWANSYLIVAPVYHKMSSPKVRVFLDNFSDPNVRKHLRQKTVSAMTVSARSDENHIDLLKNIYTKFISHGSIVVPAGLSDRSVLSSSANAYGYRQVIGEKVEEELVDRQIQRLVDVTSATYSNYSANGTFSSATNL